MHLPNAVSPACFDRAIDPREYCTVHDRCIQNLTCKSSFLFSFLNMMSSAEPADTVLFAADTVLFAADTVLFAADMMSGAPFLI